MRYSGYHFTGDTLRDGRPVPAIGETLVHDGEIEICASGLHFSRTAWQALSYAPGNMLHRVWCEEIIDEHIGDKAVCRKRTIVATIDTEQLMREFGRKCALDVIHLWDAPQVVVDYLNSDDESLRAAAWAAARDAAWAAAWAAARDAAWDAARDAAWDAARDAAWAAAWAAARDAARAAARDAAWAAAWAAARDAAWDAAWDAARAAAWAAARDAAWDDQGKLFDGMVDKAFGSYD